MRIRITFSKTEAMRYTGHLDLHRAWERTFRRANLPLAYSQGFHPQPRLALACALPLGFTSQCEVIDIWIEAALPIPEIEAALGRSLPPGLAIHQVAEVDRHNPALQTQTLAAEYTLTLYEPLPDLDQRLERLLDAKDLPRERRGKSYDLRPLIDALYRLPDTAAGNPVIGARLAAREGATGRPEELLAVLGLPIEAASVERTNLIFCE